MEEHPVIKTAPTPNMKVHTDYPKPARTAPAVTRSALPLMTLCKSVMCRWSGYQGDCIPLRIGSGYVGSLRGKDGEVVNMAVEGRLYFCFLQETRYRGQGARKMGAYKLFWMGCAHPRASHPAPFQSFTNITFLAVIGLDRDSALASNGC